MGVQWTKDGVESLGAALPLHIVRPDGPGPFPGLVVIMEIFGVNDHMRDVAERFAREGYVAILPDLYCRHGNTVLPYTEIEKARATMFQLYDEQVMADMDQAVAHLKSLPYVRADRLGMVGYCWGGRISFMTACRSKDLRAAVVYYGGRIVKPQISERVPAAPIEAAPRLSCPLLGLFGEADASIPLEEVEAVRETLSKHDKQFEIVTYPGAGHGFFCDQRPEYHAEAARDAWQRTLRFFATYLRA